MICDTTIIFHWTGDLFDMLLPMLSIYQEYVRNHHYSLQVSVIFKCLLNHWLLQNTYTHVG